MRLRELVLAVICGLVGGAFLLVLRLGLGDWPSPAIVLSLVIATLGGALVVVRYGRLGPFSGELGNPRTEAELRDTIVREVERSRRYARDLTLVALRESPLQCSSVRRNVRSVDYVVECRRNITILVLPETSSDGAMVLLRRITAQAAQPIQAAVVAYPSDGKTGDDLCKALLRLVRQLSDPGTVVRVANDRVERLSLLN